MRGIQKKLLEKRLAVSLGKVLSQQPFLITYPTKKEISLCFCKMCLNARLLFEPIKTQAKKDGDVCPDLITEYFVFLWMSKIRKWILSVEMYYRKM